MRPRKTLEKWVPCTIDIGAYCGWRIRGKNHKSDRRNFFEICTVGFRGLYRNKGYASKMVDLQRLLYWRQIQAERCRQFRPWPGPAFVESRQLISRLAPKDIKHTRKVKYEFIDFLNRGSFFYVSFMLDGEEWLFKAPPFQQRDVISRSLDELVESLKRWQVNTPSASAYLQGIIEKLRRSKIKLESRSGNLRLFRHMVLIAFLAAHLSYILTKYASAQLIGWGSDRDAIVDTHGSLIYDFFHLAHHDLCFTRVSEKYSTRLSFLTAGRGPTTWFDEFIRIPDCIAGTLADYNWNTGLGSRKFIPIIEKCLADNPRQVILRLAFANDGRSECSRIVVSGQA